MRELEHISGQHHEALLGKSIFPKVNGNKKDLMGCEHAHFRLFITFCTGNSG